MKANHDQLNLPTPVFCRNNCGFYGNEQNDNYCSKCYNEVINSGVKSPSTIVDSKPKVNNVQKEITPIETQPLASTQNIETIVEKPQIYKKITKRNICAAEGCRKKLTLTSVECKCGKTFCSMHRYAEEHECSFDYKTKKEELLSKANPIVAPQKLNRI